MSPIKIVSSLFVVVLAWVIGGWLLETRKAGLESREKGQEKVDMEALIRAADAYHAQMGIAPAGIDDLEPYFTELRGRNAYGDFTSRRFFVIKQNYLMQGAASEREPWILPRFVRRDREIVFITFRDGYVKAVSMSDYKQMIQKLGGNNQNKSQATKADRMNTNP